MQHQRQHQHFTGPDRQPRAAKDNLQELTRRVKTHGGGPFRIKLTTQTASSVTENKTREQWKECLRQNSRITSVDVRVEHLNRRHRHHRPNDDNNNNTQLQPAEEEHSDVVNALYQVLQDVGMLPNLTELKISGYCRAFPLQIVANLLEKATDLVSLAMTSVKFCGNKASVEALADAVACHENLMDWKLLDCQFVSKQEEDELEAEEEPSSLSSSYFLDTILSGAAASRSMELLALTPTRPNAMGSLSHQAIQSLASLKSLKLGSIGSLFSPMPTTTALATNQEEKGYQSPFETLMELLASNDTNLRYIHIPFVASKRFCQATNKMILQNTTLRELALRTYHHTPTTIAMAEEQAAVSGTTTSNEDHSALRLIARALAVNTTLLDFELLGPMRLRQPALLREFATVLHVNYTLQDLVLFELVVHPHHNPSMMYQAKLNQHGRKQWLEDMYRNNNNTDDSGRISNSSSNSKDQQVAFLEQLGKDTDDLYYYLSRMNPSFLENLMVSK